MSTPYRVEYKGIISIANGYDGYPRDVLQEIIPYDLEAISNDKHKWIADLALGQDDYYGTKIDNYGEYPAEYTYIVESNNNNEFEVTIYNHSKKIAMVNLTKLSEMPADKYKIMLDEIQYACECLDIKTKNMIESFGHKIYVDVNDSTL
jgi:hypothetical protein